MSSGLWRTSYTSFCDCISVEEENEGEGRSLCETSGRLADSKTQGICTKESKRSDMVDLTGASGQLYVMTSDLRCYTVFIPDLSIIIEGDEDSTHQAQNSTHKHKKSNRRPQEVVQGAEYE